MNLNGLLDLAMVVLILTIQNSEKLVIHSGFSHFLEVVSSDRVHLSYVDILDGKLKQVHKFEQDQKVSAISSSFDNSNGLKSSPVRQDNTVLNFSGAYSENVS